MAIQRRRLHAPYLVVGVLLLAVAAVTAWDASTMRIRANYGVGPDAASYLVAGFLVVLGLAHLYGATRRGPEESDATDWWAIGWIALALASLIASIWLGGGFILGSAMLFALTARAFGRRALLVDFLLGFILAVLVYLLFHGLLKLTLPVGPLERLL
jgi:putative tricarboxylic transport membrane protein